MDRQDGGRRVCVVGGGYVGVVTAAGLADAGCRVHLVEIDRKRLEALEGGRAPFVEPGLDALLERVIGSGHLTVSGEIATASEAELVVIAVGTPTGEDGGADLTELEAAVASVASLSSPGAVLVIKSTVPPGTTASIEARVRRSRPDLSVVACPEFLREGSALEDFRHPARVVVGGSSEPARRLVAEVLDADGAPVILTDSTSAEMIKYGSNAFLALKISFINEIAHLCDLSDADVAAVADGIGADPRIGRRFLEAGLGFGGSCFPKDVRALEDAAAVKGHSSWLLRAASEVNMQQRHRFIAKVREALGGHLEDRRIAVLGLAFKPGTDDLRQAPAIEVIRRLRGEGAEVVATDPVAIEGARTRLPAVRLVADPYDCVEGSDAVILATEWPEYRRLDWSRVARSVSGRTVIDGRNCLDGPMLRTLGFTYISIGRPTLLPEREPVTAARGEHSSSAATSSLSASDL